MVNKKSFPEQADIVRTVMHAKDTVKFLRKQTGFTLLELLIALTILAIGLLGLAGFHVAAIRANMSGFKISTATAIAQERIEELKALDPSSSALSAGNHDDGSITVQGIIYNRSYIVQDDTPVSGTSTITLTVSWVEPATGVPRSTKIFTRITKG